MWQNPQINYNLSKPLMIFCIFVLLFMLRNANSSYLYGQSLDCQVLGFFSSAERKINRSQKVHWSLIENYKSECYSSRLWFCYETSSIYFSIYYEPTRTHVISDHLRSHSLGTCDQNSAPHAPTEVFCSSERSQNRFSRSFTICYSITADWKIALFSPCWDLSIYCVL